MEIEGRFLLNFWIPYASRSFAEVSVTIRRLFCGCLCRFWWLCLSECTDHQVAGAGIVRVYRWQPIFVPIRVHWWLGCCGCRRWSSDGHSLREIWSLVPLPIPGAVLGAGIDQGLRVTRLPLPLPNSLPERSDSSGYWRAGAGFQFQVSVSIYRRTWYKTFDKLGHRTTQGKWFEYHTIISTCKAVILLLNNCQYIMKFDTWR